MLLPLKKHEKGQALVVIAFAAIGLFAFAALAIDGSMVFSDKRHAQNAADTAALDAALAHVRNQDWVNEGLDRAESNGYDNNGTTNIVDVQLCSDAALAGNACDSLGGADDPTNFIQVQITSHVDTYFARVIGITQLTNNVEAVAEVVPSVYTQMFNGNAVVGLAPTDCHAVTYQGNADTTITGGGIFVMSSCPSSAFFNNSNAAQLTAPSLCAVGGIDYNPGAINIPLADIQTGCQPPAQIAEPTILCSGTATQTGNSMSPGTWPSGSGSFPPAGVDTLQPGVYCLEENFRVAGGDSLTGISVTIKMTEGDVRWEGNGNIHLEAPSSGATADLLLYIPSASNCEEIVFNGTSDFFIQGSVLAPCSDISVNGTGNGAPPTGGIVGQLIGYTVDLSGTSNVTLHYDDAHNYDALTLPEIKVND